MINDDKKSFRKMLKSNGLYFALGLCLLGAAVVGFTAGNDKTPSETGDKGETYEYITRYEKSSEENTYNNTVEINIDEFTTVKSEEPSTAAVFDNSATSIDEQTTEAPVIFYSPISLSIGKDYSMGVPVFSETMNDYRTHNGVDFKGVKGESVRCIATGTVVSVKKDALWGNTVTIDHGNGVMSSISGLADEALIANGTNVYSDTVIGVVGNIPVENADDSHIHLEIRVNGELVDPLEILGLSGEE